MEIFDLHVLCEWHNAFMNNLIDGRYCLHIMYFMKRSKSVLLGLGKSQFGISFIKCVTLSVTVDLKLIQTHQMDFDFNLAKGIEKYKVRGF